MAHASAQGWQFDIAVIRAGGQVYRLLTAAPSASTSLDPVARSVSGSFRVLSPAEKAALRREHQADLVDMETFAVAAAARARGTSFASLRVVSDDARTELPPEIARMLNKTGSYRVGAAIRAIWGRPSSLKDFWNLHAQAMEASDRLASGLRLLIRGLP